MPNTTNSSECGAHRAEPRHPADGLRPRLMLAVGLPLQRGGEKRRDHEHTEERPAQQGERHVVQQPQHVPRIGYLSAGSAERSKP
jgi:hypothetical protein